jgi:hypothetical protein
LVPNATTASDGKSITLRVESQEGSATAETNLPHSIQSAADFADTNSIGTVEVESGTHNKSVTVDVAGLTVAGSNDGTPGSDLPPS